MVSELIVRTVNALMEAGHTPEYLNHVRTSNSEYARRYFGVYETVRMNHNYLDNVTVTIEIAERIDQNSSKRIAKVKVPKDASDKVLANRVQKAIAEYNRA